MYNTTFLPFHNIWWLCIRNVVLININRGFISTADLVITATGNRTRSLTAVGDDAGPPAVMTTQLPRLS